MKPKREWRITGGLYLRERPGGPPGNYVADTLQPSMQLAMGENVVVIEHSAYTALLAEAVKLRGALMKHHVCTDTQLCIALARFDRFTEGQGNKE